MRYSHFRFAALTVVGLSAFSGAARAQSIYGPGGLFLSPTADFPAKGKLTPAFLVIPSTDPRENNERTTLTSYTLDYGISSRLEGGITYLRTNPSRPPRTDASTGGFLKYKLFEKKGGIHPVVAIGASELGGGHVNARTAFVALRLNGNAPDSEYPSHIHLGVLYADKLYGFKRKDTVPYAGIDVKVDRSVTAFAEIRARMDAVAPALQPAPFTGTDGSDVKAPVAVGLLYQPGDRYKIALALANNGRSGHARLSFGIGYAFGGRSAK